MMVVGEKGRPTTPQHNLFDTLTLETRKLPNLREKTPTV